MKKIVVTIITLTMLFLIFNQSSQVNAATKYSFKNNVATLIDINITIIKTKVIQPGKKGNEYGDKAIFAIWYKTKNKTGKKIDPFSAWIAVFNAYQDNKKNYLNELDISVAPDEKYFNTQFKNIKKGRTLTNAISYELSDKKTPVQLVATKGYDGIKLGSKKYKIKK